jgi:hypothetical protein
MRKYLPASISKNITLEQAFARSGFLFVIKNNTFNFKLETEGNCSFLNELLLELGLETLDNHQLAMASVPIDQMRWIDVWQSHSGGAEGGPSGVQNMEMQIMDSFLAGVARWLSALGCPTSNSCDGHGRHLPNLRLADPSQSQRAARIIDHFSKGRVAYAYPLLCPNVWQTRDKFYNELLDLAEELYCEAKTKGWSLNNSNSQTISPFLQGGSPSLGKRS